MKIKWKFEEERKNIDEHGNLKPYYNETEPWTKVSSKPNVLIQIFLIIVALAVCFGVIVIAFSLQGFDWSDTFFVKLIRDLALQRM